jgi:Transposase
MDMSTAYEAAAEAKMPHAEIVHDRFHVAKHLNEAVDKVRRTEHRKLQEGGKETLTAANSFFSSRRKTSTAGAVPGFAICSIAILRLVEPGRSENNFATFGNVPTHAQL